AAGFEPGDGMHECDLGGVASAVEHPLAEERAPQRHAIESTHQRVAVIDLDAVAMAALVESAIKLADALVDPGAGPAWLRLRAAVEHAVEVAVDGHRETVCAHEAGEPLPDEQCVQGT